MIKPYFWIALALNYVPLACALLLFRLGAGLWLIFLLLQGAITEMNCHVTTGCKPLLFLSCNQLISTFAAHCLSTLLYYRFVSSDDLTPVVGQHGLYGGLIIVVLLSAAALIARKRGRR